MSDQQHTDFIVSELLSELKAENNRKDAQIHSLHKTIVGTIAVALSVILLIVAGFLWYLNQYDFTSYETSTAEGVYALIDSEGNVITSDLTPDEVDQLIKGVTADGESN